MFALRSIQKLPKSALYNIQSVRKISETKDIVYESLEGPDKGIVTFAFNRPKQKNALNANLINDMQNAIHKAYFDSQARVVVLRSTTPGVFCAGADLKERLTMPIEAVAKFVVNLRSVVDQIHNLPIPVIAAIDGLALGGGLEISLACDIRVASTDAKMGLVEARLGIMPGAGGTQRLPRLINPSIAKELIYTARIIDGTAANQLGIINHVVPQNANKDAAYLKSLEIAREILPNGPIGIQMAKKSINKGVELDLHSGLTIEEACYAQLIPTRDRMEGLKAFSEKRKPVYTGQ